MTCAQGAKFVLRITGSENAVASNVFPGVDGKNCSGCVRSSRWKQDCSRADRRVEENDVDILHEC